jgi:transcriptional regulator with XRE-family HTH domain
MKARKVDGGTFASRLAARLKQLDVSYSDLGNAVGVSKQAVGIWCSGEATPNADLVARVAHWLGLMPRWLLNGDGQKGRTRPLTMVEMRQAALRSRLRAISAEAKQIRAELRALGAERDEAEERAWTRRGMP